MPTTGKASILVVDDEENIRIIIQKVLSMKGHAVCLAPNAEDALAMLDNGQFDLLITDHLMPGKTGLELVIEAHRNHPDLVKILLTGVGNRDLYREAINKGDIFSVIEKPFKSENFLDTVDRALKSHFRMLSEKNELLRIRNQYHMLFDATTDLIQCIDGNGQFIYVNPAWYRTLGYSPGQLPSLRLNDIIHQSNIDGIKLIVQQVWAGMQIDPFDCQFVARDGSPVFLEGNAAIQHQDSDVVAVTFILRDITERKKAAEILNARLRQETMIARIANLLANTDQPSSIYMDILRIIGESATIDSAHFFEIRPETEYLIPITDWFDHNVAMERCSFREIPRNDIPDLFDRVLNGETVCYTGSGDMPPLERSTIQDMGAHALLVLPIQIGGRIAGALAFMNSRETRTWDTNELSLLRAGVDILANAWRRQQEIDARMEKEQEAEQSRFLVIRADRLAALGTMTAGIIHEITQPLNAINVSTQTILYGLQRGWEMDSEQIKNSLDLIVDQIKRMSTIIKNMRAFARDGYTSEKENDNLNRQVDRIISIIGEQLKAHNIDIRVEQGDIPNIRINTQQILQVIMNLVTNARQALDDFERDEKWIRITTREESDAVVLEVADNGPGIPVNLRERVFDPFFTTKEVGQGTGLGLSICTGFVQEHKGTLDLGVSEGGGAMFIMRLPKHPSNEGVMREHTAR